MDSPVKAHGERSAYMERISEFSARFPLPPPRRSCDTIGIVEVDRRGRIAAGTSTTGLFMKLPGRVGDSPIVGAGLYADDRVGGATATGMGEIAIVHCLSRRVCDFMSSGLEPREACRATIKEIKRLQGYPGDVSVIALDKGGNPGAATSLKRGFTYAYQREDMVEPVAMRAPP